MKLETAMKQTLVISGHPNLSASYANKIILDEITKANLNIMIRKLDALYPEYRIDVEREQRALLEADTIVLQFPFYWYSVPALLKKWIDDVFCYGFAYGSTGTKLRGKDFLLSFTIGGPSESYTPLGFNHFPIRELLHPLEQTAYLSGMIWNDPLFTHSMIYIPEVYNKLEVVEERARDHASRLVERLCEINAKNMEK